MKKKLNINVILIGGLLVIALAFFGWQQVTKVKGAKALVMFDNKDYEYEIDLSKDAVLHFDDGKFLVTLEVKDGAIRFIDSKCPDHLCEGFGFISHEDEFAVCMPAGVSVFIDEGK